MNVTFLRGDDAIDSFVDRGMSCEEISTVRFGVFVQGRGLRDWEWKSIKLLRAGGASCLFILVPQDAAPRRPSAARALDSLVLRIAGLPAESGPEVEEPDPQQYQPSMTCVIQRTAAGEPALSSAQRLQLSDRSLKFILFFGAGGVPEGLPGCAELGVWRFTRSSGAAKLYPFIHGLYRRDDVVSFGLEQIAQHKGNRRLLLEGHFRARGERNRSVAAQVLSEASRWPLRVLKHVLLNGDLPRCAESGSADGGRHHSFALLLSLLSRDVLLRLASKLASHFVLETWNVGFSPDELPGLAGGRALVGRRAAAACIGPLRRRSVHLIDNAGADPAGRRLHLFRSRTDIGDDGPRPVRDA